MTIRTATFSDLDSICQLESVCFPTNEAASRDSLTKRLQLFPDHFWLLEDKDKLVGFVNGMVTDTDAIVDEMFEHAELHTEKGSWQSIFGLAVTPEYRRNGYAEKLINQLVQAAKRQSRKGVVLTCKLHLISYYEKLGFEKAGLSNSVHGGEVWYDMKMKF